MGVAQLAAKNSPVENNVRKFILFIYRLRLEFYASEPGIYKTAKELVHTVLPVFLRNNGDVS